MITETPNINDIETWIFDLDNTLYHVSINLFEQIDRRMCNYVAEYLNISRSEAYKIQKGLFRKHGTTLRGMMEHHNMDPEPYLNYVHEIDFSCLKHDKILAEALNLLPGRKYVFTNATKTYAKKVLIRLGIEGLMEDIFDIIDSDFVPKPEIEPYKKIVEKHKIDPNLCVFVEDIARNLRPAYEMGMTTVWIENDEPWAKKFSDSEFVNYKTNNLSEFLKKVNLEKAA